MRLVFEEVAPAPALLSARTCAALAGCTPSAWRALVARREAPPPAGWRVEDGLRGWDAAQVMRWLGARPGSGNHARGRQRSSPQTRTRPYAQGGEPAYRDKTPKPARSAPPDAVPLSELGG